MSKEQNELDEIRSWLRENAKQVKGFDLDNTFNKGSIVTHERKDLGPKGYEKIEHKFDSFESLKAHYERSVKKISPKEVAAGTKRVESVVGDKAGIVKRMVRRISKKGN